MLNSIAGLPAHPLLVHGAVVLVPAAAIVAALAGVWPAARARVGIGVPILALMAVVAAFLAKESGEELERRPGMEALHDQIERHSTFADATFIWALVVLVLSILIWASSPTVTGRVAVLGLLSGRAASIVLGVLGVLAAAAAIWGTVAVGHSGAEMVWGALPG